MHCMLIATRDYFLRQRDTDGNSQAIALFVSNCTLRADSNGILFLFFPKSSQDTALSVHRFLQLCYHYIIAWPADKC
jgi:hypothetical protein